ncbi:hypothetical protein V6N13_122349 [Hibiscus sabdariffa]
MGGWVGKYNPLDPGGSDTTLSSHLEVINVILCEIMSEKHVPEVILIDFELPVIDRVRTKICRQLFHLEKLNSCKEPTANNFAKGHYTFEKFGCLSGSSVCVIFMSNASTMEEGFNRKLFNHPNSYVGFINVDKINMIWFLFEYEKR